MKGALVPTVIRGKEFPNYRTCPECGTDFPLDARRGIPRCNGVLINRCPWCREDSRPWRNGRGI
ncbi:hypothetical protein EDC39_11230 [Geothermobacter ehrlichii]|uniref:Uncharacterized protein n=1 Tax=Geothermobacter ehrlichii TaxID=213224 RepID=A0A5D3WHE3_9BACT|nr:hypothetical protein EDC39_11230 [Geothermobacter ehrlichii]